MDIRPLTIADITPWAELLAAAFGRQPCEMARLCRWMYAGQPVLAWGAWDGLRLAAQYCSLDRSLHLPGAPAPIRVGQCANMAVHPDYRGRGLVKQLARPVYEALAGRGGIAGVGFSNAAGVQVDRHSKSYGYHVVGQMVPALIGLTGGTDDSSVEPLDLQDTWPEEDWHPAAFHQNTLIHFGNTPEAIRHRFALHPFRRYRFGVWRENRQVRGIVIDSPLRLAGLPVTKLLAAYSDDLPGLMERWSAAVRRTKVWLVHLLASPASPLRQAVSRLARWNTAMHWLTPISHSPCYLTVKPLCPNTARDLLDFDQWDCMGGDVL